MSNVAPDQLSQLVIPRELIVAFCLMLTYLSGCGCETLSPQFHLHHSLAPSQGDLVDQCCIFQLNPAKCLNINIVLSLSGFLQIRACGFFSGSTYFCSEAFETY